MDLDEPVSYDSNKTLEEFGREFQRLVLDRKDDLAIDYYNSLPLDVKHYIKGSSYCRWLRALSMSRI